MCMWVGSRIMQAKKFYPICYFSMLKIVPIMLKLIHQFCLLASYAQTSQLYLELWMYYYALHNVQHMLYVDTIYPYTHTLSHQMNLYMLFSYMILPCEFVSMHYTQLQLATFKVSHISQTCVSHAEHLQLHQCFLEARCHPNNTNSRTNHQINGEPIARIHAQSVIPLARLSSYSHYLQRIFFILAFLRQLAQKTLQLSDPSELTIAIYKYLQLLSYVGEIPLYIAIGVLLNAITLEQL